MAKRTTMIRVYTEDKNLVRMRFPRVRSADFFHMALKSNPFIQIEAALRKDVKKIKKK